MQWRNKLRRAFELAATRRDVVGEANEIVDDGARLFGCQIAVRGNRNRLVFERSVGLRHVRVRVDGDDNQVIVRERVKMKGSAELVVSGDGGTLEVGMGTTIESALLYVEDGASLVIGRDCMLAYDVEIRTGDGHSLFLEGSEAPSNVAADTRIGDGVWIAAGASVLKGVHVGPGAVIAARSLVTRDVTPEALVAGVPARSIREGIRWNRLSPREFERRRHSCPKR